MKTRVLSLLFLLSFFVVIKAQTDRVFKHPGITYTKGDIDRMKAMIQAKREPYYSTFLALLSSPYSSCDIEVMDRGNKISSGKFNGTIGIDGRRAIDLALLWHLTDEDKYGEKAEAAVKTGDGAETLSWFLTLAAAGMVSAALFAARRKIG